MLEEIKTLCKNEGSIIEIEYFINKAYNLSELSEYELIDELKKYCLEFNRKWKEKTKIFHISIYSSGKEIIEKISKRRKFLRSYRGRYRYVYKYLERNHKRFTV